MSTDQQTLSDENTQVINKPEYREPGDEEKFSHYVDKDKMMVAMFEGTPVTALCGKTWVPTRDPQKFPVCPTCKEVWESLPDDGGGG